MHADTSFHIASGMHYIFVTFSLVTSFTGPADLFKSVSLAPIKNTFRRQNVDGALKAGKVFQLTNTIFRRKRDAERSEFELNRDLKICFLVTVTVENILAHRQ